MNSLLRFPALFPLTLISLLFFSSCQDNSNQSGPTDTGQAPLTVGLFSPIQLEPDSTVVPMTDYFPGGEWPDEIMHTMALEMVTDADKKSLIFKETGVEVPTLSVLTLKFGNARYDILMKASRKVRHTFSYSESATVEDKALAYEEALAEDEGEAEDQTQTAKKVQIAGEMTNWNPENGNMVNNNGTWELEMLLNPGAYQYQIVVDGEWILDPANPVQVPNGIGGINSQVTVGGGDKGPAPEFEIEEEGVVNALSFTGEVPELYIFWGNQGVEHSIQGSKVKFELPEKAKGVERSYLRIYLAQGRSVIDYLFPLTKGLLVRETDQLIASDQHQNILYFMLVDRFFNGDESNDAPLDDERVLPPANYHGGDLAGVKAKLESGYFKDLGINTLWISPLNQNPEGAYQEYPEPRRWFSGYHGYWPVSSSRVDHRFGSNQELKALVDAAHGRNTKVILDFVANHVHEEHPLIKNNPTWKTELDLPDGTKNIRIWDEQRLTTWFDDFLPSLDFSNPEVIETQVDSALFWLKEFNLDGFRHDATKHIPLAFWRRLQQRTKLEVDRPLFQIGETFGSRELIGSYVGTGMLDGQFDFNLYFDLRNVLTSDNPKAEDLVNSLDASLSAYGYHSLMGNVSGNHDMPRFIAYAGKDLGPDDDAKEVGWQRKVGVKDPVGYRKLEQLHAFLMIAPGIPVVYYGDEIGMSGANDPDNRRDMRFDNLSEDEAAVKNTVKTLTTYRRNMMALNYGQTTAFAADEKAFVMVREYLGEAVILVINLSDEDRSIVVEDGTRNLPDVQNELGGADFVVDPADNTRKVEVKGNGFLVLGGRVQ